MNNVGEYCHEQEFQIEGNLDSSLPQFTEEPVIWLTYRGESKKDVPFGVTHVTVDPSVKRIENNAFQNSRSLRSIVLSPLLETIGKRAFSECTWLEEIQFQQRGLKSIGSQAFQSCHSLFDLQLPEGLEWIDDDAFFGCESLKSISIPNTVETIGTMAFCGCFALVDVNLCEGLKFIGPQAFRSCTNLVNINLPNGLKLIGKSTFHWCKSLRTIRIPETVEVIEGEAFRYCASLVEVRIPEGLRIIGRFCFQECKALSAVALSSTLEEMDSFAFCNCSNLLCVEIPRGMNAKFDNTCLNGCNALRTMSVRKSDEALVHRSDSGTGCVVLDRQRSYIDRFVQLPVHDVCYYSSNATVDDLIQALDSCNFLEDEFLKDALGMTPFHIVATSPNRRVDMLNCLLDRYPLESVWIKDELGMTMMDYLLKQTSSSRVIPLIQTVLQKWLVDPFGALQEKWRLELSLRVERLSCHDDDGDNDDDDDISTTVRQRMKSVLEYVAYCTRIELTAIAELALWKMKMSNSQVEKSENDIGYRESCRCQCGADIVMYNTVGYLWDGNESKDCTALSVYPICSTKSIESD